MGQLITDESDDDTRAFSMEVAHLGLALHFDLLIFLCDNLFQDGLAKKALDFDHKLFMRFYRVAIQHSGRLSGHL